jgi:hypothetical protein
VVRNYCERRLGFATITIPDAASYRITTPGFQCSDAIVNGERLVTCSGPDLSSGKLSVCNDACTGAPSETDAPVVCDPGYDLEPSAGTCTYAPIALDATASGCPAGYNLIERGGRKICALGLNQNGQCAPGTYFDGQYGACVSPGAGADAPYGINDPAGASQLFQGCAPGYTYDPGLQCCQAIVGGAYPGCPLGFAFDLDQNACVPHQISASSPGCVTVSLNIARCQPVDEELCVLITDEASCKRTTTCLWDDRKGSCQVK